MANREARIEARRKLAVRAERAFGLSIVPRSMLSENEPAVHSKAPPKPSPVRPPIERPVAQAAPTPPVVSPPPATIAPTVRPLKTFVDPGPFKSPVLSSEDKRKRLIALDNNEVRGCTRCRLCEGRTQTVFGEGSPDAELMFIGEGPGATEDEQGKPFVGRSGDLLTKQINAMGLHRDEVFIANVVKCRPPENRTPTPDEVATCTPYLERQIEIIRPRVIVTLGLPASQHMLQTKISMSKMRGTFQSWRGIQIMPTFHPAYLLRSYTPANRAMVWNDLQQVMKLLNLVAPKKGGA